MEEAVRTDMLWERVEQSFWKICQLELQNISVSTLILCILAVAVVVHAVSIFYVKVKKRPIRFSTELLVILLLSYIFFIAHACIFSRVAGSQPKVFDTKHLWIDDNMDQNMTNLLNIVLFIPYGALIAGVMERRKAIYKIVMTVMYCFITSLLIECVQYITGRGYFEIDDIEANALGAVLGSMFVCLCVGIGSSIGRRKAEHID